MQNVLTQISKTFTFNLGKFEIYPTYWQAGAIVFLLFLLLLTLARLRHMYVNWSLGKSAVAFLFWGFLLAVIMEGFMIIGGRTILTELLGLKNVPKPISTVLDISRERLTEVLGDTVSPVPGSVAKEKMTFEDFVSEYEELPPEDAQKVNELICKP